MSEINRSFEDIEDIFRKVVMSILGLPDKDEKSVRFPFGSTTETGSAPGIKRTDNVCFVYVVPADDGYGQQHHISYIPEKDSDMLTYVDEHTDVYTITFACYGPKGHVWAQKIKDGLYRNDIRRLLKCNHFYLKTGIPPIVPLNELRESEWWRRFDVSPTFYSFVRLEQPEAVGTIEDVNIILNPGARE